MADSPRIPRSSSWSTGPLQYELDIPAVATKGRNLIGAGRGVPPAIARQPVLDVVDFYRLRGIDEARRGNMDMALMDLKTADALEDKAPLNERRFSHRTMTGNRFHKAGLYEVAKNYRAHTVQLFDRDD